jgi:hypothetical protein
LVLSTCSRNGRIDDGYVEKIVEILKALIVAQYNTLEKQYRQQLVHLNQQFAAKREAERKDTSKGSRPVATPAPIKADPVAQGHIDSSFKKAAAVVDKDSAIQPTQTISKEKLRFFLEKAWKFLESEDDQKIFIYQVIYIRNSYVYDCYYLC